jgi:molecular chaperone HtpG
MNSPIDNHFIQHMEGKLDKTSMKRVDADVLDKLIVKDAEVAATLSEEDIKRVKEIFEKAINNKDMKVEVENLNAAELPVHITMEEWMRRMKDMARMGGGGGMNFYGSLPDSYKVSINGNHKLVTRILDEEDEAQQTALAKQAFDLALLAQGLLKGADLTAFVERSVALI